MSAPPSSPPMAGDVPVASGSSPMSSASSASSGSSGSSGRRRQMALGQVILVEGNISAGKTTIARALGEELGFRTFFEPTQSNPYLEKFYADPGKYALRMQIWLLKQRYNTYLKAVRHAVEEGQGVILDRSVFSDWVFAAKNLADGNIDAAGYAYYELLRKQMLEDLPLPDAVLYLDVTAGECHRRIVEVRQRACESAIPLEYLQGLDECYQQWLRHMEANGTTKTFVLPWENFGDHSPILQQLRARQRELASPERAPSQRALELLYSTDEIRKAQVLEHDLWSDDEHEHSLLDTIDVDDIEQRAHALELRQRLDREQEQEQQQQRQQQQGKTAAPPAAGSPIRDASITSADTSLDAAASGSSAPGSEDDGDIVLNGEDILGDERDAAAAVLAQ